MQYGDLTLISEPATNFEGKTDKLKPRSSSADIVVSTSIPSTDAELASAYARFMATGSDVAAGELIQGVQDRQQAKRRFSSITAKVAGELELPPHNLPLHLDCHFAAHKAYLSSCGEWDSGALPYSATLAQLCAHAQGEPSSIIAAIANACMA